MRILRFRRSAFICKIAFSIAFVFAFLGANRLFAQESLEQLLSKGMENHPEIVTAKAKVALAEAELNATRLQVARQIIAMWGNRESQNLLVQKNKAANEAVKGSIPAKELMDSEAKLHQIDTELQYLIGKSDIDKSQEKNTQKPPKQIQIPTGPIVDDLHKKIITGTMEFRFVETPLDQVITWTADNLKFPVYLDKDAFAELSMSTDSPVTMNMMKTPLVAAIQAFEDQNRGMQVQFVIRDYGILLTTVKRAEAEGYYPVLEFAKSVVKENSGGVPTLYNPPSVSPKNPPNR